MLSLAYTKVQSAENSDWLIERIDGSYALDSAKYVSVTNKYGNIRIRKSVDAFVTIIGMSQRHKADPRISQVKYEITDKVANLEIIYPEQPVQRIAGAQEDWKKRRMDITLLIPRTLPLNVSGDNGLIQINGHEGPVEITSVGGKVSTFTSGTVRIHSRSGSVSSVLLNSTPLGVSSITTYTGSIDVLLMDSASMTVDIRTANRISTDYSLEVEDRRVGAQKIARATVGAGEYSLGLRSEAGDISLRRNYSMELVEPKQ